MPPPLTLSNAIHTLIVDRNDHLIAFGDNSRGQLGLGTVDRRIDSPKRVSCPASSIVQISCGRSHSVLLDDNHRVWCSGAYMVGRSSTTFQRVEIPNEPDIVDIAAGSYTTFAVDTEGRLWSWGTKNDKCQLGRPGDPKNTPEQVDLQGTGTSCPRAHLLAAGGDFTIVSDDTGAVYCFGDNSYGPYSTTSFRGRQPKALKTLHVPTLMDTSGLASGPLRDLGAGTHFIALVDSAGKTFTAGLNDRKQLGRDKNASWSLEEVRGLPPVQRVFCGAQHTIVKTVEQELWGWGKNKFNQLGISETSTIPISLTHFRSNHGVVAGVRHTFVISFNGEIWAYGTNSHGQAGLGADVEMMNGEVPSFRVSSAMVDRVDLDDLSVSISLSEDSVSDDFDDPSSEDDPFDAPSSATPEPELQNSIPLKIHYSGETRRGECSPSITSARLETSFLFGLHPDNIDFRRVDEDGDYLRIDNDITFQQAVNSRDQFGLTLWCDLVFAGRILRMSISPNPAWPGQKATIEAVFKSVGLPWPRDTRVALSHNGKKVQAEQTPVFTDDQYLFSLTFTIPADEKGSEIKYFIELFSESQNCSIRHTQNTLAVPLSQTW